MKKADQRTGIVLLIFSGSVIEESWKMPQRGTFGPGMGFFPLWLGVLLAILSILLIVNAWQRAEDPTKKAIFPGRQALVTILVVLAAMAAYIALLEVLGFLVTTMLLNTFLMRIVMRESWKMTVPVALIISIVLYLIFQVLLEVNLPENMYGF
jgi:putative tricarboxylic transport membrane protein